MTERQPNRTDSVLRQRAETRMATLEASAFEGMSAQEICEMVYELRVHEIELEMQNQELRETQYQLELSRDALLESEERYRLLYEFAPVGYLTIDPEGTILEANLSAARTLRITRGQLPGRKFADFVAPEDQERWYVERRTAVRALKSTIVALTLELDQGIPMHVELALTVDRLGGPGEAVARLALLDVTDRRKREFDLRTASARATLADQRERRSLAEELHGNVEQALALTGIKLAACQESHPAVGLHEIGSDLIDVTRHVAAVATELCPTVLFDLGIIAAAQRLAEDVRSAHGIEVVAPKTPEIGGMDEVARITLYRTLRELLMNAVQHSQARVATIRIWREEKSAWIEVQDSGIGFSTDRTLQSFGLLDARQRLEQLGGRLEITSHPGEGTCARACLPLTIDVARLGGGGVA